MEKLFVKILQKTLLMLGFLMLVMSLGGLGISAALLFPTMLSPAPDTRIQIAYSPISEVSGAIASAPTTASPSNAKMSDVDRAATSLCAAQNELVKYISGGQLSLSDMQKCANGEVEKAKNLFAGREQNYFEQQTLYFQAIKADPQIKSKYPSSDASEVTGYVNSIEKSFDDKFAAEASRRDQRTTELEARSTTEKTQAMVAASIAATTFAAFLVIAFLIVAVRIEKHLANIEQKMPSV